MNKEVSILLVGINGYGHLYLKSLLNEMNKTTVLVGVVDIYPEQSSEYNQLINREIPIYKTIEQFYQFYTADLAIISTPIHLHKQQSICAMENGSNVLCEKPVTSNPDDLKEIIAVRDREKKFMAIGFNWSYTPSIQRLKKHILEGKFGKVKRCKTLVLWPRTKRYYNRSSWAGKKFGANGEWIFDSIVNNAAAHFLHNLFYLLGDSISTSAFPMNLQPELYRANDIETFDTCTVRMNIESNVELLYIASHATARTINPVFVMEFDDAVVSYDSNINNCSITAEFHDGSVINYGNPEAEKESKLSVCLEAIKNNNHKILCGIEAATPHVYSIQAMFESMSNINLFPEDYLIYEQKQEMISVIGLSETLINCFCQWKMPSQLGIEWANPGNQIDLERN